jgi:ABC-type transport system involved in cytochrome bd biosynthesis fused ATPase/permease subunit
MIGRHEGEAVALLPAPGGYRMVTGDGGVRMVDASIADAIESDAWTLHAPMPAGSSPAALAGGPTRLGQSIRHGALLAALAALAALPTLGAAVAAAGAMAGSLSALAWLAAAAVALAGTRALAGVIGLRRAGEAFRDAGPRLWDRTLRLASPWLRERDPMKIAGALREAGAIANAGEGAAKAAVAVGVAVGALVAARVLAAPSEIALALLAASVFLAHALIDRDAAEIDAHIAELDLRAGALAADCMEALPTLRSLGLLAAVRARDEALEADRQRFVRRRGVRRAVRECLTPAGAIAAAAVALAFAPGGDVGVLLPSAAFSWLAALDLASALRGRMASGHARARLATVLAAPTEPAVRSGARPALARDLCVRGLAFAHAGASRPLLTNVDLTVAAGEVVAVQGASGAGKSTLLRLILGLEAPDAGQVLWSGAPLPSLDPAALRARIGVVLQDQRPPGASLRSILAGPSTLDEESAWRLACEVGLADEIQALPMGLETLVGIGTLSPAAGQRLLVGRALAGGPDFVILDETLSALDPAAQLDLVATLRRRGVACLLFGHGESLAAAADRVYRLAEGALHPLPVRERIRQQAAASKPPPPMPEPSVRFRAAARHRLKTPLRSDDPALVLTPDFLASTLRHVVAGAFRYRRFLGMKSP